MQVSTDSMNMLTCCVVRLVMPAYRIFYDKLQDYLDQLFYDHSLPMFELDSDVPNIPEPCNDACYRLHLFARPSPLFRLNNDGQYMYVQYMLVTCF